MKYLPLFLLLVFAGCKRSCFNVFPGQIVKIEVPQTMTLEKYLMEYTFKPEAKGAIFSDK